MNQRKIIPIKEPSLNQRKLWVKLTKEKHRHKEGLFLAEGLKVVRELKKSPWITRAILVHKEKVGHFSGFLAALESKSEIYGLTGGEWRTLTQDKESEGIMAVVDLAARPQPLSFLTGDRDHLLLLYQISNPHNLGAILRTAHWFGVKTVFLSQESVDFTNPKTVRTSMGSLFHLNIIDRVDFTDLLRQIVKNRYSIVVTAPHGGVSPHYCRQKTALILGSETHGLPQEIMDLAQEKWSIPRIGQADSLSLPQAAAIVIYEATNPGQTKERK